jgi:hypothetical protein
MTSPGIGGFGSLIGFRNPGIVTANKVIIFGTSGSGLFIYSPGSPALGNLVVSGAGQPGTDAEGNAYVAPGLGVYGGGFTTFLGLVGGVPELQFRTGLANEKLAGNLAGGVVGSGTTETMQLLMSGPQGAAIGGQDWAQVYLISNNSAVSAPAQGQLRFVSTSAVVTNPLIWGVNGVSISNQATIPPANQTGAQIYASTVNGSNLKYVASDGNSYDTGRQSLVVTGTPTINTTARNNIPGLATNVGTTSETASYHIRGAVYYTPNQAAGSATLGFAGTAVMSADRFVFIEFAGIPAINTSAAWVTANIAQTNTAGFFQSAAFGATDRFVYIDGIITVATPGTFALQAGCTVAADTWTIKSNTYIEILPVST